ncbi:MAG: DUF4367 domain-containing protein, partial [Candidatus Promineifilaceae bacterium]|nr:DUF4367 domain-containing protein [Candidatus Promineifilaceae bacterium]
VTMKNDDFLTRFREAPRPEFADTLYERINKPMSSQTLTTRSARHSVGLMLIALLLMVAILFLISPSARAFAQEQFRQIGAIIFVDAASQPLDQPFNPQPTVPAPEDSTAQFVDSRQEASRLAGFEILTPAHLPSDYTFRGLWSVDSRDSGVYVVSSYETAEATRFLTLNQIKYESGHSFEQRYQSNETVQDITVNDQAGVWITGRLMADPSQPLPADGTQPALMPTNWLIWSVDEITYTLYGAGLSQEEMLQIAESLDRD